MVNNLAYILNLLQLSSTSASTVFDGTLRLGHLHAVLQWSESLRKRLGPLCFMVCFSPKAKSLNQGSGAGVGNTSKILSEWYSLSRSRALNGRQGHQLEIHLTCPSWHGGTTLWSRARVIRAQYFQHTTPSWVELKLAWKVDLSLFICILGFSFSNKLLGAGWEMLISCFS